MWLATEPMHMRAGTETALARVIAVFGAAKPQCAYLFANQSLASRQLNRTLTWRVPSGPINKLFEAPVPYTAEVAVDFSGESCTLSVGWL
ncbi:IS66 Orf2 like protein [Pseudomonas amygdali pv. morsprunorum]|uniref:IS66 Orf2 like protein n=1 Tax=Pseudomonas amygdali pv. morsprunorum TaxID=129138 RepID=A0A3M2X4E3_PSEA0|nr:IS66 Orf2 like protein [Pseudomonas amygdali pv. morsprunorum]